MRCKFCGSTAVHDDTAHKTFSGGKAVIGAAAIGVVGAAAGFIGKEKKGYRCASCGQFMTAPMDFMTESNINSAIRQAESGSGTSLFDYYKRQYPNISANIPAPSQQAAAVPAFSRIAVPEAAGPAAVSNVKTRFAGKLWQPGCPVFVKEIIIKNGGNSDLVSLNAVNMADKALRSAYINAIAYDDTGDKLSECRCVYQQLSVEPGMPLPIEKEFPLGTDAAYRVELNVEKASFMDDSVWRAEANPRSFTLPEPVELNEANFARFRYIKTNHAAKANDGPVYMPAECDGFWVCDCGLPVLKGKKCLHCGEDFEKVMAAFDQKKLIEAQAEAVKERAKKRSAAVSAIYRQACSDELERKEKLYSEAVALSGSGSLDELRSAREKLLSIGGYKDSGARAEELAARIAPLEAKAQQQKKQAIERQKKAQAAAQSKAAVSALLMAIISIACSVFLIIANNTDSVSSSLPTAVPIVLMLAGLILAIMAKVKTGANKAAGASGAIHKISARLAVSALLLSILTIAYMIAFAVLNP